MNYIPIILIIILSTTPAFAQEIKNPSLSIHKNEIEWYQFNTVARESPRIALEKVHEISWQVTIDNDLMYNKENSNAILRFYDHNDLEKFIEISMGSPPDDKLWVAVNIPEKEGYVIVNNKQERGWIPTSKLIASYTNTAGLTINNGERIVVSNLDIGSFAISEISVHSLESSTDKPSIYAGKMTLEILSGDPKQNVFHLFPFYVTAAVGIVIAILFLTKKR